MLTNEQLLNALSHYGIPEKEVGNIRPYGNGHINETYLVTTAGGDRLVLQKINTHVFKDPQGLMQNMEAVCRHMEKSLREAGDTVQKPVTLLSTKDGTGTTCYIDGDGNAFKLMECIEGVSIEETPTPALLRRAAAAFGQFQRYLAGFPAETLHETIPFFHDTRRRFANLRAAIEADRAGRVGEVAAEIAQAEHFEKYIGAIVDGLADGSVPTRVTHNDTKINNLLFNEAGQCVAVIDLDTVMPGSMLYDFGDALRSGGSSAAEDETDLSRVYFREDLFEAFAAGFLGSVGGSITARERELLPLSVLLMTYECGIRFLTDYLDGDVYFRIHHPGHNLERARNQFALCFDIEKKLPALAAIVAKY